MKYTPSINIAQTAFNPESYIVTQNAKGVVGNIVTRSMRVYTHLTLSVRMEQVSQTLFWLSKIALRKEVVSLPRIRVSLMVSLK